MSYPSVEAAAHDNPRRPGESWIGYSERLAVLAGLLKPEQAARQPEGGKWSSAGEALEARAEERPEWWDK